MVKIGQIFKIMVMGGTHYVRAISPVMGSVPQLQTLESGKWFSAYIPTDTRTWQYVRDNGELIGNNYRDNHHG